MTEHAFSDRDAAVARQYLDSGLKLSDGALAALLMATDAGVVVCAIVGVDFLYHSLIIGIDRISYDVTSASILAAIVFLSSQYILHAYAVHTYLDIRKNIKLAFLSWIGVFFVIGWVGFLMKITEVFSRAVFSATFLLGLIAIILVRLVMTGALKRWLQLGRVALRKAYLVYVGDPAECDRIVEDAARYGVRIAGITVVDPADLDDERFTPVCRNILENIREAFYRTAFNETYIVFPWPQWPALNTLRATLSQLPLSVFLLADANVEEVLHSRRLDVGRLAGFEVQRAPLSTAELRLKRILDVTVALVGLVLLAPLLAMVSLAIFLESGRPIIFHQQRKGFGGKPFTIYKFRTMQVTEKGDQIVQARRNDSRVTRLGVVLRRTSIDEVPQLFNVLKGNMSIVGPRPHAIAHDEYYHELIASYAYRQHVKPGLTGWAQIHGFRGETRVLELMAKRVEHDLWYINNWSIWLDLQIMLRTLLKMLFDRSAY